MARACLMLLSVLLLATACGAPRIVRPARMLSAGDTEPPRVVPPAPSAPAALLVTNAKAVPHRGRGWLPARDGDPFAVVFTPTIGTPGAAEVRDTIIAPLLSAGGFKRGVAALRMPPAAGVALPAPEFAPLARAVAFEYAAHPSLLRPETHEMLEVFLGRRAPDADVDRALLMGEGMTFAQFKTGIERREIVFPFVQTHRHERRGPVVIERAMLLATAWEGESVRSVQGALLGNYSVTNSLTLDPGAAVTSARRALTSLRGVSEAASKPLTPPQLVLLPFGSDASGLPLLRYAYRMHADARWRGQPAPYLVWVDAETGGLLQAEPLYKRVAATGQAFKRDPGIPGTVGVSFEVDAASSSGYTLALSGVATQLIIGPTGNVSISATGNGSSSTLANFDQSPHNDRTSAVCQPGNTTFQQVSLFSTIVRHHATIVGGGMFTPFPRFPWHPQIANASVDCNADFTMRFNACDGARQVGCPDFSDNTLADRNLLSFAHDHTVVAHEVGHSATYSLTTSRPDDWCEPTNPGDSCPTSLGWGQFHDLADFWGAHLESTNCLGGWVAKNLGGTNASLYCARHDEGGSFPRLLQVQAGSVAGDHFPEHRAVASGDYADGQIVGAALWEVRAGMRSKCRPSGVPQFAARFQRALVHAGSFTVIEPGTSDLGTYQRLVELLFKMTEQWATVGQPGGLPAFAHNGAHTTNKVTAGFARAGLFLVPWQCLDGDASNDTALACPAAAPGADAVVDIDDSETSDDDVIPGATVVDRDFLRLNGPAPTFHVWTGPRYRLDDTGGAASFRTPAPCNAQFKVEASLDPTFATITAESTWKPVQRTTTSGGNACYGTWTPEPAQWTALQAGGAPSLIYYRARTQDEFGGTERLSTLPGNGLWSVPPPYAVITMDGRSDY